MNKQRRSSLAYNRHNYILILLEFPRRVSLLIVFVRRNQT